MEIEELATKKDIEDVKNEIREFLMKMQVPRIRNKLSFDCARMYLGEMPEQTLRVKTANHEIASYKIGKRVCYDIDDLDDFLANNRRASNRERSVFAMMRKR